MRKKFGNDPGKYTATMDSDGYARVRHPKHGVVAAALWHPQHKRFHDIAFMNEEHHKANAIRMPAMTALGDLEKKMRSGQDAEILGRHKKPIERTWPTTVHDPL